MLIGFVLFVVIIIVEFIGTVFDGRFGGLIDVFVVSVIWNVFVIGIVDVIVKNNPIMATMSPSVNGLFLMNLVLGILYWICFTLNISYFADILISLLPISRNKFRRYCMKGL